MCNTNNCPTGVATQKPELRARLDVAIGASKLSNFLNASTQLLQVLARACGHTHLSQFDRNDHMEEGDGRPHRSGLRWLQPGAGRCFTVRSGTATA